MADKKPKEYYQTVAKKYIDKDFNMTKALKQIGGENKRLTQNSLEVKASRLLNNDKFRYELAEILKGIDKNVVNNKLTELLEAKHITDFKGESTLTEHPNYSERRKTLEMILNLAGAFPKDNSSSDPRIEYKVRIKSLNLDQLKGLLNGGQTTGDQA